MAAQPLPFADYGGTEERPGKPRPVKIPPRQQLAWEQFSIPNVPARTQKKRMPIDQQPPIEVMVQSEASVSTPFTETWSAILAEIDALAAGTEDEVKPTEYAFGRARSTVEFAFRQIEPKIENIPQIVPEYSVTTDDVGGLRLAWRLGSKQVRANFGADVNLRSYIYFESPLEHQVEALDAQHLAGRLAWLTGK